MEDTKYIYYIYETTNLINNKTYIGQHITKDLNDRYLGSGSYIKKAIKKYGRHNFKKEILLFAVDQNALNILERGLVTEEYIAENTNYNLKEGGRAGGKLSEFAKSKLRGKKHTEEHKRKISEANRKKKHSVEVRLKMSMDRRGKNYIERYGVEKSEEIKKKASLKLSGTNNPMYGKKRSDLSKRNKSEESKNNLSKKAKLRALNGTNPFIIPHTCSVCGKVGKGPNMFRYHNDNCKLK